MTDAKLLDKMDILTRLIDKVNAKPEGFYFPDETLRIVLRERQKRNEVKNEPD